MLEAGGIQSLNGALQALRKPGQVSFPGDPPENPPRLPHPNLSAGVAPEDKAWAALTEAVLIQD